MNTYFIAANGFYRQEYVVEADSESEAINMVEMGDYEPENNELQYVEDIEVTEVEYGDKNYTATLTLSVVARGSKSEQSDEVKEALWDGLATIDGKTQERDDVTIEFIGFNIEHLEEA